MRELLQQRQSDRAKKQKSAAGREPDTVSAVSTHEQLAVLRRELNGLVAAWHHRTGQAHGITHSALRKECGGPAAAIAERRPAACPHHPDQGVGGAQDLLRHYHR